LIWRKRPEKVAHVLLLMLQLLLLLLLLLPLQEQQTGCVAVEVSYQYACHIDPLFAPFERITYDCVECAGNGKLIR
jgi:hypothetical protein